MQNVTPIKRKIQYVAGSTYVVSLPKRWVNATIGEDPEEVKKNTLIIIPMQDGSLTIYPERERSPVNTETIMKLDQKTIDSSDLFRKRLISKYLAGFRVIRLVSQDVISPEIIKRTEDIVRLFIGCEIVEMNSNKLAIRDLLALGELPIEQALGMMNLITRSAIKTALQSILTQNETMAQEVANLEDKVDQYHYLITRQLNNVLANPGLLMEHGLKLTEVIDIHTAVHSLERISDHAEAIANKFLKMLEFSQYKSVIKMDAFTEILSILKEILTCLTKSNNHTMEAFLEKNSEIAFTTIQTCRTVTPILDQLEQLSYEFPRDIALNFVSIADRLTRIADYHIELCEIAMDRAEFR